MLIDEIKTAAKNQKVIVFFDMDGTLVEFRSDPKGMHKLPKQNFYLNNRPLTYMLGLAKEISEIDNVEIHILSNCQLAEQIKEKKIWLSKNAKFIKNSNIHIICYENLTFNKEEKPFLKGNFIKNNFPNTKCFLIEDDLRNIKSTNSLFPEPVAFHISSLIK